MALSVGAQVAIIIAVTLLTLFAIKLWYMAVKRVQHAELMLVERLGSFHKVLTPGLHFLIPFIDRPRYVHWRKMEPNYNNSSTKVIDFGKQSVITKDTVQIDIDALVYFRITDARAAVYRVQNLPDAVEFLTQATLRDIVAQMTLDDTFSSREQINAILLSKVQRDAERWGVTITRVEVFSITPNQSVRNAMEKQIQAERERRSNVLRADGHRESKSIESRGHAAQMVLRAEGDKNSAILSAKGRAEARKLLAQAEAQSLNLIRDAVAPFSMRGVDFSAAVEYLKTLSGLGHPGKTTTHCVLMPVDTVDTLGNISGGNGPARVL